MTSKKQQYLMGVRSGTPVIFGFVPVGIAYAIVARQAGFSVAQTVGMSLGVFAGASQIMAAGMVKQGAGIIAIILTTFILNLRHLIMSTCVVNRLRKESIAARLLVAFGVTDESFAIFTSEEEEKCTLWYYFGLVTMTYSSWVGGSAIGAIVSDFLPAILTASFGIALYALFIGLLFPNLPGNLRLTVLIILTAVCNSLLCIWMDSSWALVISTLVCAFLGVFFVELESEEDAD